MVMMSEIRTLEYGRMKETATLGENEGHFVTVQPGFSF